MHSQGHDMPDAAMHALAEAIAREVVAQLTRHSGTALSGDKSAAPVRPCVMVLGARDAKAAAAVREALGGEADILFYGEPVMDRKPERHVLPHLCCASMADLALGRASGALMTEVLRLLLTGTTVEVLSFGYTDYAATAPSALYALYEGYARTLAGYGLVPFRRKAPDMVRVRETLVTERTVTEAQKQGASTLLVSASAVVTPLAADVAAQCNMQIRKE